MKKLFDSLTDKQRKKLLKSFEAHTYNYKKNALITGLSSNDNMIAYIEKGYIQIIKNEDNGSRIILEELEEEEVFGTVLSTFTNTDFEIIAKEDTTVSYIDYHLIFQSDLLNRDYYNEFVQNLFSIIAEKEKEKNERISILTKKTIRNKLLEYFEIMSKKHSSKYIYLPYNFTDLADYLGVDRCAMSRELKYLKEEGFIEVKGKRITLLKRQDENLLYKYY